MQMMLSVTQYYYRHYYYYYYYYYCYYYYYYYYFYYYYSYCVSKEPSADSCLVPTLPHAAGAACSKTLYHGNMKR
jgi:hypothetical protein